MTLHSVEESFSMNKKSILSLAASVIFLAAMSFAQSTSGDQSQGTQGSSPTTQQDPSMGQGSSSGQSGSMGQGSSSGQSGSMGQGSSSGQSGSMGQGSSSGQSGSMSQGSSAKGEKKMKGCITSEGGQYMLQDKHGKSTPLSGQDLSAHVGHEVTVHGTMGSGGSSNSTAASSGSMGSGTTFNVTNVDMISESCTSSKTKSSSGSMQK
jgi:hypothetical protein